jgi:5-formyltetrahydrofolate cyclo-ligase
MPSRKSQPAPKPAAKSSKKPGKKTPAKVAKPSTAKAKPAKAKPAPKRPAPKKPAPKAKAPASKFPVKAAPKKKPASAPVAPIATGTPLSTREKKIAVRREMKESLARMRERARRSKDLCKAITEHPSWRRSVIVAIFAPMEMEPDVELLWKYAEGKTVCYPTIRMGGLDFMSVGGPDSVTIGQFGIREPIFDQSRVIPPDTFDLVLVPGSAFTANGDRLGRGGGFYDRLLSSPGFRAFKVGVCFDRQVLDSLPLEAHDQRVHRVVTESGWLQRPDFVKAGKPNA